VAGISLALPRRRRVLNAIEECEGLLHLFLCGYELPLTGRTAGFRGESRLVDHAKKHAERGQKA
jgi:hypothetical protein